MHAARHFHHDLHEKEQTDRLEPIDKTKNHELLSGEKRRHQVTRTELKSAMPCPPLRHFMVQDISCILEAQAGVRFK